MNKMVCFKLAAGEFCGVLGRANVKKGGYYVQLKEIVILAD